MIHKPYTWLEVSQSAFDHNIAQFKKLAHNKNLAPVVKANAYGHGLLEIAKLCEQNNNINWLCTALLSDALFLRKHNVSKPILVLSCINDDIQKIINQNIALIVDDLKTIEYINTIGKQHNYVFPIHLKIDTGMSRFGIFPEQALEIIKNIQTFSNIKVDGICTHFAQSSNQEQAFTQKQYKKFVTLLDQLKLDNINIPHIHAANSAGVLQTHNECNFFRIGIGMYGYWSSPFHKQSVLKKFPDISLKPVLTWKTRIMRIKDVPRQNYIGYDRTYTTTKNMRLGLLPIGYFDGYDPRFSNKAHVLIKKNNRTYYAPVIGRVCMNVTMIDATDIPNISVNDEVIVLGSSLPVNGYTLCWHLQDPNVRKLTTCINHALPRYIVD